MVGEGWFLCLWQIRCTSCPLWLGAYSSEPASLFLRALIVLAFHIHSPTFTPRSSSVFFNFHPFDIPIMCSGADDSWQIKMEAKYAKPWPVFLDTRHLSPSSWIITCSGDPYCCIQKDIWGLKRVFVSVCVCVHARPRACVCVYVCGLLRWAQAIN